MKTPTMLAGLTFVAAVTLTIVFSIRNTGLVPSAKHLRAKDAPRAENEERFRVPVAASPVNGKNDALVTVVEFSDFHDPFCARAVPLLAQIAGVYGDEVRVVFKNLPQAGHPDAALAAEYALAAHDQGKFWPMHDRLFAGRDALDRASLQRHAAEVGLDTARVEAFIASGRGRASIAEDRALAERLGVGAPPAFFVDGIKISGVVPFSALRKVIDAELARAKELVARGVPRMSIHDELTKRAKDNAAPPATAQRAPQPAVRQNVMPSAAAPKRGAAEPLILMVEFSDFECPLCGGTIPVSEQLLREYGADLAIEFRQLPLPFHRAALPAAKASLAAHRRGKFWEYYEKLFANQRALAEADLEKYAAELGLDREEFRRDLDDPSIAAQIEREKEEAAKYGVRGTPTIFVNGVPVRGVQTLATFKAVIEPELARARALLEKGVARRDVYRTILASEAGKSFSAADEPPAAEPAIGSAPLRGSSSAPVKIIAFSDFECSHCALATSAVDEVLKKYGNRVALAFKQYPLPNHPRAELASVAALAAQRQGKFWEMHDKLFANQRALAREDLVRHARELGLDAAKLGADLDDPELRARVKADIAEGVNLGVTATPTFFVNGRRVEGAGQLDGVVSAALGGEP